MRLEFQLGNYNVEKVMSLEMVAPNLFLTAPGRH